jgi:hypothetical protein
MAETQTRILQFFNQKPTGPVRFITFELWHADTGTLRFVRDFIDQTLTLEADAPRDPGTAVVFTAASFDIPDPAQGESSQATLTVDLGRVGSGVKTQLKKISEFGFLSNMELIYRQYLSDDVSEPVKVFNFFVSDINLSEGAVSLSASDDNPTNQDVGRVYTFLDFPGLVDL